MEGEAVCRITFKGPMGTGRIPYNFVFALIEKEPVVRALKPSICFFENENVVSFQIPLKYLSTQTDLMLKLGLIDIYLNSF